MRTTLMAAVAALGLSACDSNTNTNSPGGAQPRPTGTQSEGGGSRGANDSRANPDQPGRAGTGADSGTARNPAAQGQ